jgi:hypothetical protein|tara:strand:- start:1274 stop:2302 length:1029 start_codon:yes stop_codon:yes gene_type:complete
MEFDTFATNVFDNFSDNSFDKNWDHFEKLWKNENGEGVVANNSYIDFVNINDTSDVIKKKCLVIRATGDNYNLIKIPKGLKTGKSQRVGGGVKSKDLMGPGEYNIRVKFSPFDSVCNALWLFNYLETDEDDVRHIKNKDYCINNNINNTNIINPEIDFESLDDNKCRCNIFKSTEGLFEENLIDLNKKNIEINDKKWHNLKYIWETDIVKVSDLIGRELKDDELVITKENFFIRNIKEKSNSKLNGMSVIKSIEHNNEYCFIYGKKIEIILDDITLFTKEVKDINLKSFYSNTIPDVLQHFYIALWFPSFIKKKPDFFNTMMYIDTFKYLSNGNPVNRLTSE